ncbi:MAG: pyrroloquinoline quinone biosynthesis protein PqqB [Alphaproteobacteria bacterium]|nr:pyrroloquinoline quinone biosynthesis protein PqqB [Alphaproteobacteria bacterium]
MLIKVLGSAAGGGFPQWNCNGRMSARVRRGEAGVSARTQSSLAVSSNGRDWVLLNASPDLRQQINETSQLWPDAQGGLRNSPIKAVVLTNGDVDHVCGLINLREGQAFSLYASDRVLGTVNANSVFNVLNPEKVDRIELAMDTPTALRGGGSDIGITIEAFDVPGKVALYLEDASKGQSFGTEKGDTIGLKVTDTANGKSFYYIPGCADVDEPLAERIRGADLVMFDGTLYTDDEMIAQGLSHKSGQRMGHISMSGDAGSVAALKDLGVARKIYVHINNSNPALDDNSPERKAVEAAGWEVSYDGMEVEL